MSEYPENTMFPPDFKKYGTKHNGYKNGDYEVILYDFAASPNRHSGTHPAHNGTDMIREAPRPKAHASAP